MAATHLNHFFSEEQIFRNHFSALFYFLVPRKSFRTLSHLNFRLFWITNGGKMLNYWKNSEEIKTSLVGSGGFKKCVCLSVCLPARLPTCPPACPPACLPAWGGGVTRHKCWEQNFDFQPSGPGKRGWKVRLAFQIWNFKIFHKRNPC